MPARRKRTKVSHTSRKRPVLPEGVLETSMNDSERIQKLEVYLRDFDGEVKTRIVKMKSNASSVNAMIQRTYKLEILKLPPHIRKMKVVNYLEQGGMVDNAALEKASNIVTSISEAVLQNAPRLPLENLIHAENLQTPAESTKNIGAKNAQVQEIASNGRVLRSSRKRKNVPMSPTSCKTKPKTQKTDSESLKPPMPITRSTRKNTKVNQIVTPMAYRGGMPQPPFVTPKFDPRQPLTPALLREAKAGERIMSLSGSPLANPATAANMAQVFIPIGNGKTFQFTTNCHLSPSQAPSLSNQARKNVKLLQEQLSRLLKVPPQLLKK